MSKLKRVAKRKPYKEAKDGNKVKKQKNKSRSRPLLPAQQKNIPPPPPTPTPLAPRPLLPDQQQSIPPPTPTPLAPRPLLPDQQKKIPPPPTPTPLAPRPIPPSLLVPRPVPSVPLAPRPPLAHSNAGDVKAVESKVTEEREIARQKPEAQEKFIVAPPKSAFESLLKAENKCSNEKVSEFLRELYNLVASGKELVVVSSVSSLPKAASVPLFTKELDTAIDLVLSQGKNSQFKYLVPFLTLLFPCLNKSLATLHLKRLSLSRLVENKRKLYLDSISDLKGIIKRKFNSLNNPDLDVSTRTSATYWTTILRSFNGAQLVEEQSVTMLVNSLKNSYFSCFMMSNQKEQGVGQPKESWQEAASEALKTLQIITSNCESVGENTLLQALECLPMCVGLFKRLESKSKLFSWPQEAIRPFREVFLSRDKWEKVSLQLEKVKATLGGKPRKPKGVPREDSVIKTIIDYFSEDMKIEVAQSEIMGLLAFRGASDSSKTGPADIVQKKTIPKVAIKQQCVSVQPLKKVSDVIPVKGREFETCPDWRKEDFPQIWE